MSGDVEAMLTFWRARLDETEASATAAAADDGADWFANAQEGWDADERSVMHTGPSTLNPGTTWDYPVCRNLTVAAAEHIARHDPARTLWQVEADRQILSAYEAAAETYMQALYAHEVLDNAETKRWLDVAAAVILAREVAAKLRVSVYRGHPDYQAGWAA